MPGRITPFQSRFVVDFFAACFFIGAISAVYLVVAAWIFRKKPLRVELKDGASVAEARTVLLPYAPNAGIK